MVTFEVPKILANKQTHTFRIVQVCVCVCNGKLSIFAGLDGVRCLREEDEARKLQAERWRESGLGQGLLKRAQRVLTRKLLQLPSCNEASRTKRTWKFFPQSGPVPAISHRVDDPHP